MPVLFVFKSQIYIKKFCLIWYIRCKKRGASEKYSLDCTFYFGNFSGKRYVQLSVRKVFLTAGSTMPRIFIIQQKYHGKW